MISCQSDTSHWPYSFSPTATTVPSDLSPTVWPSPALTAMISRQSDTSHSPSSFQPTATTVPSALTPTVWIQLALTVVSLCAAASPRAVASSLCFAASIALGTAMQAARTTSAAAPVAIRCFFKRAGLGLFFGCAAGRRYSVTIYAVPFSLKESLTGASVFLIKRSLPASNAFLSAPAGNTADSLRPAVPRG